VGGGSTGIDQRNHGLEHGCVQDRRLPQIPYTFWKAKGTCCMPWHDQPAPQTQQADAAG
jgi:hypothetical protein